MINFPEKSIAVVLGTRPEIVKLAHIIRLLGDAAWVVHTGQHYDPNLSDSFFTDLSLPQPDVLLKVGGRSRGAQIGEATTALDSLLADHRAFAVVVQGDTNAVLAGALAANARSIPLVHVEAGLRSFDRAMPEEHNRVTTDHLSDLCLAPTAVNVANLAAEGIEGDRVVETGNTVVEAVGGLLPDQSSRRELLEQYGVRPGKYVLSTFHRPENVDDPARYRTILSELAALEVPVILPLHPRSVARAETFGLGDLLGRLQVVEPIGYRHFLGLSAESALLISDSGGVQEEASVLKRPAIVVRNSTERPEVIGTFAQRIPPGPELGVAANLILRDLASVHGHLATLPSPYGDGSASAKSVAAIGQLLSP